MKVMPYLLAIALLPMLASTCCKDCDDDAPDPGTPPTNQPCQTNTATNTKSVNFFDLRPGSAYQNQVVAVFKFVQLSNTYTGTSCPIMNCSTTLTIQNVTTKKITFDYNIKFNLNFANWNYQGVAVIAPGTTLDVGQLNTNCANVGLGAILLQSAAGVTYQ